MWETLIQVAAPAGVVLGGLAFGAGTGLVRSLGGWLRNSLEDGKITIPEGKLLIDTMIDYGVKVGILSIALEPTLAAGGYFVIEYLGKRLEGLN